ncbi:carbamoyltransferase [Candidatus Peribacteria bacterium]|jgi:carbamoyltransferase|nr:carbamoyltransferase [Candidatus Peribacteria bacterium]MBT4021182.1 carbamoyltransferase [Candidatus Peribacteria bacterium]MBT4240958.1 carbamoyltransferase [Candidatus Peribacteria bacterium]MBT4474602.1 carbamoyltransferase [Candidatus Peribacteria bacterium]
MTNNDTYILGLSCYYHDSGVVLLKNGVIVAAAQEERFTRKKHDDGFPSEAIYYCLEEAGISKAELNYVIFYDKPLSKFERILMTTIDAWPRGYRQMLQSLSLWLSKKLWMKQQIAKELDFDGEILFSEHHMSHAASTFFSSAFSDSAVVTLDGVGEWETTGIGYGSTSQAMQNASNLCLTHVIHFPHSLGLLYSAVTGYLGFKVNSAEYKVMGLAPYGVVDGNPEKYMPAMRKLIDIKEDGSYKLNMKYFAYEYGLRMTNRHFHKLFGGPPRKAESDLEQKHKDIAAALQMITEEAVMKIVRYAYKLHPSENLCLSGGVALNCVANGKVLREGPFKNIFIQPASGDAGGALGAVQYLWHAVLGNPKTQETCMKNVYFGPEFEDQEIEKYLLQYSRQTSFPRASCAASRHSPSANARGKHNELRGNELKWRKFGSNEELTEEVSSLIDGENVIGWFQGRMEFGPRALGNRSIIADARRKENWQKVNLKIKFRESFRPFAPSVLEERASDWFELDVPSPYMLLVADVKEEKRAEIPAITHVDGSARIQTVNREENSVYYDLIKKFYEKTGCPVVINTSFNVRGEPIVCSPKDALYCFLNTEMDYLVMGSYVLAKKDNVHLIDSSLRDKYLDAFDLD